MQACLPIGNVAAAIDVLVCALRSEGVHAVAPAVARAWADELVSAGAPYAADAKALVEALERGDAWAADAFEANMTRVHSTWLSAPVPRTAPECAVYNGTRCSVLLLNPDVRYGFCGYCEKLLAYELPAVLPSDRVAWFGEHRGSGKRTITRCKACGEPETIQKWFREDWEDAPRSMQGRQPPPPRSAIRSSHERDDAGE